MNRTEKQQEIDALKTGFATARNAFFFDYRGLKVEQVSDLRRKVRATRSSYRVAKNRLAIIAARETPLKDMETLFDGMTAVVWNESDPVALAKVLHEFAKTAPITIKGGVVEGRKITAADVAGITSLPARPELIATFAGMIKSPMVKFVSVLKAPVRDLVSVLSQVADGKPKMAEKSNEEPAQA
jgi:large subunit ribosomal protein L10